jgi:hypothetical protein
MDIFEQLALRMAKERIEGAVRTAEQMRAVRVAGACPPARVRLGRALVRLGHWMMDQPSPGPS